MNTIAIFGAIIICIIATVIISFVHWLLLLGWEKDIFLKVKLPVNSDCSIESAVVNFVLLDDDDKELPDVRLKKL